MKNLILILSFGLIALPSCKKEQKQYNIRYEVIAEGSRFDTKIRFTTADGSISGGDLTDYFIYNWRQNYDSLWYEFKGVKDLNILFSGINTDVRDKAILRLYVNGELKRSATTSSGVMAEIRYRL